MEKFHFQIDKDNFFTVESKLISINDKLIRIIDLYSIEGIIDEIDKFGKFGKSVEFTKFDISDPQLKFIIENYLYDPINIKFINQISRKINGFDWFEINDEIKDLNHNLYLSKLYENNRKMITEISKNNLKTIKIVPIWYLNGSVSLFTTFEILTDILSKRFILFKLKSIENQFKISQEFNHSNQISKINKNIEMVFDEIKKIRSEINEKSINKRINKNILLILEIEKLNKKIKSIVNVPKNMIIIDVISCSKDNLNDHLRIHEYNNKTDKILFKYENDKLPDMNLFIKNHIEIIKPLTNYVNRISFINKFIVQIKNIPILISELNKLVNKNLITSCVRHRRVINTELINKSLIDKLSNENLSINCFKNNKTIDEK